MSKQSTKLAIRIANAYGYKDQSTQDKIELVELNLHRWKERSWKIKDDTLNRRFWQAVNKYEVLVFGYNI